MHNFNWPLAGPLGGAHGTLNFYGTPVENRLTTVCLFPSMCNACVYCDNRQDKVVAVASMNMDPVVAQAAQMMLHNQVITKREIK